jgi:hypothetical protein
MPVFEGLDAAEDLQQQPAAALATEAAAVDAADDAASVTADVGDSSGGATGRHVDAAVNEAGTGFSSIVPVADVRPCAVTSGDVQQHWRSRFASSTAQSAVDGASSHISISPVVDDIAACDTEGEQSEQTTTEKEDCCMRWMRQSTNCSELLVDVQIISLHWCMHDKCRHV